MTTKWQPVSVHGEQLIMTAGGHTYRLQELINGAWAETPATRLTSQYLCEMANMTREAQARAAVEKLELRCDD